MKTIILFLAMIYAQSVLATSVIFPAGSMKPGNIIPRIEANCINENIKSTQCQGWVAILKNESQSLMLILQSSGHPNNVAIFEDAVTLQDTGIKTMALEYLRGHQNTDEKGLLETALQAMIGEDSFLGNVAAKILSGSESEQDLGKEFEAGRNTDLFDDPKYFTDLFINELWLTKADTFQNMYLADQERFMALDRYYRGTDGKIFGGPAFLTSQPTSEVLNHIKTQTGVSPAPSLPQIELRINDLSKEMQEIVERIQRGDYSQMARFQELQLEMQTLSAQQLQWYQAGASSQSMQNSTAFFIQSPNDQTSIEGAIFVRDWPVYQKTSIQYLNKQESITE